MSRKSKKSVEHVAELSAVVSPTDEVMGRPELITVENSTESKACHDSVHRLLDRADPQPDEVLRNDDLRADDLQEAVKTVPVNTVPMDGPQGVSAHRYTDEQCASFGSSEPQRTPLEPSFVADLPLEELPHPELDSTTALNTFPGSFIIDTPNEAEQLENAKTAVDMPPLQPGFGDGPHPPPEFFEAIKFVDLGPPPVGSWWEMPGAYTVPYVFTIVGAPVGAEMAVEDYIKENGMVSKGVGYTHLDDFKAGLYSPCEMPEWVRKGRAEFQTQEHAPEPAPEPIETGSLACQEIAAEIGVDVVQVNLLVESGLSAIARLLSLKSIASSSPVIDGVLRFMRSPEAMRYIGVFLAEVLPLPNEERLCDVEQKYQSHHEAINELVSRVDGLVALYDQLNGAVEYTEKRLSGLDNSVTLVLEAHRAKLEDLVRANQNRDTVFADSLRSFEPFVAQLDNIKKELISIVGGQRESELQELQRSLICIINEQLNPIREEMSTLLERQDDVEMKRLKLEDLKRKQQKKHAESMRTPKEEQLELRRARDKTAREQKKRDNPTVQKSATPGEARGRGRPKGSTNKPNLKTAQTIKAPKPVAVSPFVDFVAQIMGDRTDSKIKKLLGRVLPHNFPKFASQIKRGIPDLPKLTDWSDAERWAFTQWYYSGRAN